VCSNPSTAAALCGPCAIGQVYDTTGQQCVAPAVVLTAPPASGTANTQLLLPSIVGTGIPGQTVTVSVNGLTACTVTVESDASWSCVPSTDLPLGSNIVTANSAGAISSATLVVQCTLDPECDAGQVCNIVTGVCTTPSCTDNAGAGTTANCPSATPVCESPGTSEATCAGCATSQVYDTTAHVCLPGMVVLATPPAGGSSTTTSAQPALDGIGVPGQTVMVTSGAQTLCVTVVLANGTWTCTSTVVLPPGSNIIVAHSAGATSTGTLVEHCTLNVQCASAAPACEVTSGLCVGCVVDTGCATGTFCDATHSTCAPTLPAGATCERGAQCAAGVCTEGLCRPASADGGVGDGGGADVPDSGKHVPTLGGGGCDCTTTGTQAGGGALAGLGLLLLALARRRSRQRSQPRRAR
jgi:MYXO-CTERM domain-containing protein